ncbi:MAG TPA: tRNA (guanosine(37)-N1)-methyltransferase TrmD [Candidatus Latescibacteria bacterium]|jgi:tRNA (guanine37-N1)-methyltransferase|nr:tRNA (guanosine(37)-N1)-methyltransferase TrmD [Gemmatimonadota bacterium]MDP7362904.1 tRNA (guanosine(37)-N1)-methyltransferase TrmD [Candidatus Latescibacterota bacterium]HCV26280.1 tRNA (guanosine(37)-N1)-methyltransferase TrmD [Candidatus Latescibacterota bacterium]HJN30855.1 tRNA (guanosine(37)-N1)-methyltransferase TrmD [Candidatus Latescibacterota bacterium]
MQVDIVTLFPRFFVEPLATSIVGRAIEGGQLEVNLHDLRTYSQDRHRTVDDTPYGGGGGMVIKPGPVAACWTENQFANGHCIHLSADGEPLTQDLAAELSLQSHMVLLCGHYKGVDERARRQLIDQEISIGDYVLTGGEPAALVLIDAVTRLIPGVLGNFSSAMADSFHDDGLLDCPWYTRPASHGGEEVPQVLLGGDHGQVQSWRRRQALRRTFERRPDLLERADLDEEERRQVADWRRKKEE